MDRGGPQAVGTDCEPHPLLQGAEGQKPGFGYGGRASDYKSTHKGLKGHDAQGTLSKIFKLVTYLHVGGAGRGPGTGLGRSVDASLQPFHPLLLRSCSCPALQGERFYRAHLSRCCTGCQARIPQGA